jgi:hypothetical protein
MAWFECIGGSGGGASDIVYKTYAKFYGTGIVLPWLLNTDYKIECVFHDTTYKNDSYIMGSTSQGTNTPFMFMWNNKYYVSANNSGYTVATDWAAGEHTFVYNDENSETSLDDINLPITPQTSNSVYYTLGCSVTAGGYTYTNYIKSFKIYSKSTGTLLHDLKPCLIKNLAAIHDVVSDNLYTCANLTAVDEIPS